MNRIIRILIASLLTLGLVGPFSMATTFAQTQSAPQAAGQSTGAVTGSIHDSSGAPVANATVKLVGASTLTASTDAQGAFTFTGVTPGIYNFTATKAGYTTATESSIAVLGGQSQALAVVMNTITFSSLRTIATVRSVGRGTFNTTPASVSVVTSQTFQDQSQPQVMKVLNETPGIVASLPATGGNGAAPGAITFPNIRGALSFESASLIDGHPVSVGTYGDYVTTFINPFMLQNVEVVKGPGADAPEVNYAIGGTVNFRTKDPTFKTSGMWQVGTDNWGSTILNFGLSDTVGRLGYVFAYGSNDLQSNLSNTATWVSPQTPQQGVLGFDGTSGTGIGFNDKYPTPPIPGTISTNENSYNLVACCQKIGSDLFQNQSELAKLRYRLSNATSLTFTYIGSQTHANQVGNTGSISNATFDMSPSQAAGYTGSLPNNSPLDIGYVRTPEYEINNEPILEGDLRTTLNNDTILARYYSAGIHRLIYQGSDSPFVPTILNMQLYGYDSATKQNYNGQTVPVAFFDYYNQSEEDALKGYSFEYDHPFGANNVLTLSVDSTHSTTTSFSQFASGTPSAGRTFNVSTLKLGQSVTLPTGSAQDFTTAMLRGSFQFNPKLHLTWSNYFNSYKSTYPTLCSGVCKADGTGFVFSTTTRTHYDPRVAIEYRATPELAVRFSAGSAIAPPYLALLSGISAPISTYTPGKTSYVTQKVNAGNLLPETAFGEDLGASYRFHDGATFVSADVYHENLFNHFVSATFDTGATCPAVDPVTGQPTNCPAGQVPLYFTTNKNLANARFEGIELELRRVPVTGLGYTIQGALQRGYAYNLPPYFYCLTPGPGCKPNTNLGIIEGQNFSGGGIGGNGLVANGLSNQNVPYAQGFGELNYRTANGWYANVNLTYYGKNNSLYVPPFTTLGASLRAPLGTGFSFQISGDNLTDKYSNIWPNYGAGIQIPLANGQLAATQQNVLYPRTIRFTLTKSFGEGVNTGNP